MTAIASTVNDADRAGKRGRYGGTTLLIGALLALGAALRIARWVHFRSLWLDEIYLSGSIVNRTMRDLLFQPLDNWQAAPAGYLFLVHCVMGAFGSGERSLRLVSLLFGLASLPLMLAVSRRVLGVRGVVIAMALFSVLGPLVYYSNEVKPYSCDATISLAITLTALRWQENRSIRRAIEAATVGAIGAFLSFPAIFVLGGAGVWMIWPRDGSDRAIGRLLLIFGAWAIAFAIDFLIFVRPYVGADAHSHVVQYWLARGAFMPRSPVDAIHWIFSSLDTIAHDPGGMWLDYPDAALIGLVLGAAVAFRNRGNLLIALAPLPLVFLAALTRQYPFGDRLALFFVPQYLLLIAAATEALWTNFTGKAAAVVIAGLIVIPSAERAIGYLFQPRGREESLQAYRYVARNWRIGDTMYLSYYARPSLDYYEAQAGWAVDPRQSGVVHAQIQGIRPEQIVEDVDSCAGHARVWVVLIHPEIGAFDVQGLTLAAFDRIGHPIDKDEEFGALVYLYDCTRP